MANMIANIPMTVSSCAENLRIDSANTSLSVFVSAPILVSRSPVRAWLWNESDNRCKWANSSRRSA